MPEFHPGLYLMVLEPIDLHLLQPLPMWDIYILSDYRYERGSRSVFFAFLWFLVRLSCPQVLLVVCNSCEALLFFWASVFICKIQLLSYFMWTHCAWLMSVLNRTHFSPHFVLGACSVSHTSFPLSPFALHIGFSSCVLSSGSVIYMDLPRKWTVFSSLCWLLRDRLDVVRTTSLSSHFLSLVCHTVEWSLLESCSVSFRGDSCVSWISTPPPHYSPPFCSCGGSIFAWSSTSLCWLDAQSWINSSIFFWMLWLLLRSTLLHQCLPWAHFPQKLSLNHAQPLVSSPTADLAGRGLLCVHPMPGHTQ